MQYGYVVLRSGNVSVKQYNIKNGHITKPPFTTPI